MSQMKDQLSRELESIMLAKLRESPFFALYSPAAFNLAAAAAATNTSTPFSHLNNQRHFLTIPRHDSGFQGKSRFKHSCSHTTTCIEHFPVLFTSVYSFVMLMTPCNEPHLILHTHLPVAHTNILTLLAPSDFVCD